jgi:hypothetical protein
MQPTRDAPLAAALLLAGAALFFGGAAGDGSLPWLTAGALATLLLALAEQGAPRGLQRLVPLAALAAWSGASIAWSTMPDRSWDYANRALVYLLFALVGACLAGRRRELAAGLAALLAAVAVWSLAGRVFPGLNASAFGSARLTAPVGLWNQLALLGDLALPLALWVSGRRRTPGTLLAYLWVVVLALTLSRGGIAVAVLVALAWVAWSGTAVDAIATLLAALVPGATVGAAAFALPGVTSLGEPSHVRWRDGLIFGALLVAGGAVAAGLARVPRPAATVKVRQAAFAVAALVVAVAIAVVGVKAGSLWHQFTSGSEVSNSSSRVVSVGSNFRTTWWQQAWHAFTVHPVAGTGAGTFVLTNALYRQSSLDYTVEPHDLPVQFLSELGIVGALLFLAAIAALLVPPWRRRGHELALALALPAFFLHGLVDVDWDFVAVAGPAFLVGGSLAARPARGRATAFAVVAWAGAAVAVFVSLLLPWLGHSWSDESVAAANPAHAVSLARRARAADPLLVEAVLAQAAQTTAPIEQLALYEQATRMQPRNADTWRALGLFLYDAGCLRRAYPALQTYTNLDDHDLPYKGAVQKDAALAFVNAGKTDPPRCGG